MPGGGGSRGRAGTLRTTLVAWLSQPVTAAQLARRTQWSLEACVDVFGDLRSNHLLECLNEAAQRNRVHWLTGRGVAYQRRLRKVNRLPVLEHNFPVVDWSVHGEACFSHRSAIIQALYTPLQPAAAKRRARYRDRELRMSSNNARDVMRWLVQAGVARPVLLEGDRWPRYELTPLGKGIRALLVGAGSLLIYPLAAGDYGDTGRERGT